MSLLSEPDAQTVEWTVRDTSGQSSRKEQPAWLLAAPGAPEQAAGLPTSAQKQGGSLTLPDAFHWAFVRTFRTSQCQNKRAQASQL